MNIGDRVIIYCEQCEAEHAGRIEEIGGGGVDVRLEIDETLFMCAAKDIKTVLVIVNEEL